MAAHLLDRRRRRIELTSVVVLQILKDGNESELEGLTDDERDNVENEPIAVRTLSPFVQTLDEQNKNQICDQIYPSTSTSPSVSQLDVRQKRKVTQKRLADRLNATQSDTTSNQIAPSTSGQAKRRKIIPPASSSSNLPSTVQCTCSSEPQRRQWKSIPFNQIEHNYPRRDPVALIRNALEYFLDYFPHEFFEEMAFCTKSYHLRVHGRILNTNAAEIKKLMGIHFIMGCIPYPRLHMYWRQEMQLKLISEKMSRDRFKTLRSSLHVVHNETPPENNTNALWKVQPIIDRVKQACYNYERVPGHYSIDEQMIPFCGVCPRGLRQVIKSKPRPQGLKAFVAATSDGLMIDFEVYQGVRTAFEDKSLGVGAAMILHLSKTIPRGSCVYFDRYFTSIPLLELLVGIGLHGTGTVMPNRIPDRGTFKFKEDRRMKRGDSEQFVSGKVVVVKWMDGYSRPKY